MKGRICTVFLTLLFLIVIPTIVLAQCPPNISLSSTNEEIIFDSFSKTVSGVTRNGITYVNINSGACTWDVYTRATINQLSSYSVTGVPLSLNNIKIRAVNGCQTADQAYMAPDPNPVTGTFTTPLSAPPNYIVGTSAVDGGLTKTPAPCFGQVINQNGSSTVNSNINKFRIDIQVVPGIAPVIQPGEYDVLIEFYVEDDATPGAFNSQTLSLRIEILPILEIDVKSLSQIDFIFDKVGDYLYGQAKYGATILNVSASTDWDLVAVATSTNNENGNPFWDQALSYSVTGNNQIPIGTLELHQIPSNPSGAGAALDYSTAFSTPPSGDNYINSGSQAGAAINLANTRTIAGKIGATGMGNSVAPGSFLNISGGGFSSANYRYTIDYRLFPGLPSTFNGLMMNPAQPGVYTMEIRYILTEDQ